jgi:hypothetical protein
VNHRLYKYADYKILLNNVKKFSKTILQIADILASPIILVCSVVLMVFRRIGIENIPMSRKIFDTVGVYPILDHYYEPLFKMSRIKKSLKEDRVLPGIDFNEEEQLAILEKFDYNDELLEYPREKPNDYSPPLFYYNNKNFKSGDAEYLYNIIRLYKPSKIVEIGSGFSTLIAHEAVLKNEQEDGNSTCEHICIEPYQRDWLEDTGVNVIRQPVEQIEIEWFSRLNRNDILFIDSSHIIRPQGDVLFEYLRILPVLNSGVTIHIHDIFTPKDYPAEWLFKKVRLWNEQYLLEAFLSFNTKFKIIGALNYLSHHYRIELSAKCPIFCKEHDSREPGSMWLQKI